MKTYPFDKDTANAGKAETNRLKARIGGDVSGFRTVISQDPVTGEEIMLRTKGGMPEVTRKKKVVPPPAESNRTFVFKNFYSVLATIANRFGAGMKVVTQRLAATDVTYGVGALRTDTQSLWRDVCRLEKTAIKLNGKTAAFLPAMIPNYGMTALPYIGGYQLACPDDAARSTLFIGHSAGVSSVSVAGGVSSSIAFGRVENLLSGVRLNDDSFYRYGYRFSFAQSGYFQLISVDTTWGAIQASIGAPYLATTNSVSNEIPVRGTAYPPGTYPSRNVVTNTTGDGWNESTKVTSGSCSVISDPVVSQPFGYAGSHVPFVISASQTGDSTYQEVYYAIQVALEYNESHQVMRDDSQKFTTTNVSGRYRADLTVTSPLPVAVVTVSTACDIDVHKYLESHYYRPENTGTSVETRSGSISVPISVTASDYVFADIDEDVYLYLKSTLNYTTVTTIRLDMTGAFLATGEIAHTYVLNVRGVEHEFPVVSVPIDLEYPRDTAANWPKYSIDIALDWNNLEASGGMLFAQITAPVAVFSPEFMSQGSCPYIAYTTRAEEAAGATPEIYVDMNLSISNPFGGVVTTVPSVSHSPVNGQSLFLEYLKSFPFSVQAFARAANDIPAWSTLFPEDKPFRVQFSNGVKGPMPQVLDPDFAGNPLTVITRI